MRKGIRDVNCSARQTDRKITTIPLCFQGQANSDMLRFEFRKLLHPSQMEHQPPLHETQARVQSLDILSSVLAFSSVRKKPHQPTPRFAFHNRPVSGSMH